MISQYAAFAAPPAVAVLVGLVLALVGFRKLGPKPGTRESSDRWHARYGKFLQLGAALLVIGALVYVLVVPVPSNWIRHTTEDGTCSVEFPEAPRHEVHTTADDVTTDTLEVVFKDVDARFSLSFSDLSPTDAARPMDEVFGDLRALFAKPRPDSEPARLMKEQVITDRGFQGREYQFAVGDQFVTRIKVFVNGRRVYRAIAVNPPGDRADRDAQKFIDSFRFEISKP